MPNYRTEDIRNLTFVGHSGSGKTTLVEALLAKSGKIGEAGTIGSAQTMVNAVVDALAPLGVTNVDMPLRPRKVWQAMQDAQA